MARKTGLGGEVPQRALPTAGGDVSPGGGTDGDLDVLVASQSIPIRGETVVVRELSFGEQLAHYTPLAALADALKPVFHAPEEERLTLILDAIAAHQEAILPLAALVAGKTVEWLKDLSGAEGEALLLAFWGANQDFFVRRIQRPEVVALALALARRDGAKSSPSSSTTDTPGAS
ncbi:MAG: hypothetical protein LBI92_06860 [Azoarcus sp.]|jgi:hypothetical protein|nr:hypothetical protein [Azoarcus sp.]